MKFISIYDLKDTSKLQMHEYINEVTFLASDQCRTLLDAVHYDMEELKSWFNLIGIRYDEVLIAGITVTYRVDNEWLSLADLSSGEKYILYIMACKKLKKVIYAASLFERLGIRLEDVALNIIKDYDEITVIVYNAMLPHWCKQYFVEEL